MSNKVYIYSVGMTKFGKFLDKSIKDLTRESLKSLQSDNDFDFSNIEAAWFSNTGWGMTDFQHSIRGQVALTPNGIDKIPITNVENACASGSTAFNGAWTAIKAGVFDCALAIGTEKVYQEDRAKMMGGFISYTDVEITRNLIAQMQKAAKERAEKAASEGKGVKNGRKEGHSVFMDFYAAGARAHMKEYGTTQRQLAIIAAKNHNNSTMNPLAQYTFPMTVDQVMEDYEVAYPLTRAMCAPVGDGSAAAILCSEKFLKEYPNDKAILVRASILRSGSWRKDNVSERSSTAAYKMAGLSPKDINVAEVHDATAYGELEQIEQMGFCSLGKGGPFTERGETELGGNIPVNTSGGLLSRGHPLGASGLAQIYELVLQLRGEAGKRQVNNPKYALAENGGGTIGSGPAAMCVHILEA
ncbi:MAG: thiolase family protein [Promethearchaeota archaeon]